jgi:hypothetical protein
VRRMACMELSDIGNFDPNWMIGLVDSAINQDPYLKNHPEVVGFLKRELPKCQIYLIKVNPDKLGVVDFYFVDPTNANNPGSPWQFKENITVYGDEADLIFDVLKDGQIGAVEVWHHTAEP